MLTSRSDGCRGSTRWENSFAERSLRQGLLRSVPM